MRYPKFLNNNSTIGVFAPSLSCPSNPYLIRYEEAKKNWMKNMQKTWLF